PVFLCRVSPGRRLHLHEEEIRRVVHHLHNVIEGRVLVAEEAGAEERVVAAAQLSQKGTEQPLSPVSDVLSGHWCTLEVGVTDVFYSATGFLIRSSPASVRHSFPH